MYSCFRYHHSLSIPSCMSKWYVIPVIPCCHKYTRLTVPVWRWTMWSSKLHRPATLTAGQEPGDLTRWQGICKYLNETIASACCGEWLACTDAANNPKQQQTFCMLFNPSWCINASTTYTLITDDSLWNYATSCQRSFHLSWMRHKQTQLMALADWVTRTADTTGPDQPFTDGQLCLPRHPVRTLNEHFSVLV